MLFIVGCISLATLVWSSSWAEAAVKAGVGLGLIVLSHLFVPFRARLEYLHRRGRIDRAIVEPRESRASTEKP